MMIGYDSAYIKDANVFTLAVYWSNTYLFGIDVRNGVTVLSVKYSTFVDTPGLSLMALNTLSSAD